MSLANDGQIAVGDRLTFETFPGCAIDLTIEEIVIIDEKHVIKKAHVHSITLTPPMIKLGKIPDGWHT